MFFCTDCHLPTALDDVTILFSDGTCLCLACHDGHRTGVRPTPNWLHGVAGLFGPATNE